MSDFEPMMPAVELPRCVSYSYSLRAAAHSSGKAMAGISTGDTRGAKSER
jgi:hypothetical protein